MRKQLTRAEYERTIGSLAIGGDLWTNERRLWDRVFENTDVTAGQRRTLLTGLWADVDVIKADGARDTVRVFA